MSHENLEHPKENGNDDVFAPLPKDFVQKMLEGYQEKIINAREEFKRTNERDQFMQEQLSNIQSLRSNMERYLEQLNDMTNTDWRVTTDLLDGKRYHVTLPELQQIATNAIKQLQEDLVEIHDELNIISLLSQSYREEIEKWEKLHAKFQQ